MKTYRRPRRKPVFTDGERFVIGELLGGVALGLLVTAPAWLLMLGVI